VIAALPMIADGSQPGYARIVLDLFLQSAPPLLDQVRQAAATGDAKKAQHAAHTLKSSSAAVGALALSACAADAEAVLREGRPFAANLAQRLDLAFAQLTRVLDKAHGAMPESVVHP